MVSATDIAIAVAANDGTLSLVERTGRFGSFYAIADGAGTIEVADTRSEAISRVRSLREDALSRGDGDCYNALDSFAKRWAA